MLPKSTAKIIRSQKIIPMSNRQSYFWFCMFALGTIGFTLVQDTIRPNYHGQSDLIKYLLGIAPNYFGRLGIDLILLVMIFQINNSSKTPSGLCLSAFVMRIPIVFLIIHLHNALLYFIKKLAI
ncbi:MAG: hypothetical protein IPK03_17445 [Bacteroidetes bacterium]|nr:hypothetical protein [Bacteroidota bacterium]